MTLRFLDIRIGQIGFEASRAALEGAAPGPLGTIGSDVRYEQLFSQAQAGGAGHRLPWEAGKPYSNKFWKKYVTDSMLSEEEEQWPGIAWDTLVPLKATVPLPIVHLHESEMRSYSEAYAWPTGIGMVWNSWLRPNLDVEGLGSILETIRNGEIPFTRPDGTVGARSMQGFYHQMLDSVRDHVWGTQQKGLRSDPLTIVSIIEAETDSTDPKTVIEAREKLFDAIEKIWDERPATLVGDSRAAGGDTVYACSGLRFAWVAANFLSDSRKRRGNCLHRNLLLSSLQVEMLGASARMLYGQKKAGSLPNGYQSVVEHVLERSEGVLSSALYSAPHLRIQLERKPVADALNGLRP